jgi:hypothetical protein
MWAAILFVLVLVGFGVCAYLGIVTAAEELIEARPAARRCQSQTQILRRL